MLDRMRGGRWKVFKDANTAWLDEMRTYHRDAKTGLIVKEADDAISARFNRKIEYPQIGIA